MAVINISIEKKHLVILSCLVALFGVVLVTNAYNSNAIGGDPEVMGHSADELDVNFDNSMQSVQQVFDSITDNSGNINYANTAGNVEWNDVNNKPNVATETWVSNNYATEDYVDNKLNEIEVTPTNCYWTSYGDSCTCGTGEIQRGTENTESCSISTSTNVHTGEKTYSCSVDVNVRCLCCEI